MKPVDDKFEQKIQQILKDSIDKIDAETQSQLTQARHHAISLSEKKYFNPVGLWVRGVAITFMLLFVLITLKHPSPDTRAVLTPDWIATSETDDLEMYQDLEFYEWLETVNING